MLCEKLIVFLRISYKFNYNWIDLRVQTTKRIKKKLDIPARKDVI
jgi:hypothetical protein